MSIRSCTNVKKRIKGNGLMRLIRMTVCIVWGLAVPIMADTLTWTGGASGTWDATSNNWSGAESATVWNASGTNHIGVFDTDGAVVTVTTNVSVNRIVFKKRTILQQGTNTLGGASPVIEIQNAASGSCISNLLAGTAGIRFTNSDPSPSSTLQLGPTAGSLTGGITVDAGVTIKQGVTGSTYQFGFNALTLNGTLDMNGGRFNNSRLTGTGTLDSRHASNEANFRVTSSSWSDVFSGVITGKVGMVWDNTSGAILNFFGNSYSTGQWVFRQKGTFRISSTNAYKATSSGKLEDGNVDTLPFTVELAAGNLSLNTVNMVWNSNPTYVTGIRFAALNAERTVTWTGTTVGGAPTALRWASVAWNGIGRILGFGSTNATHKLTWVSGLDIYSVSNNLTRQLDATGPTANPTLVVGEIVGNISDSGTNSATMTLLKSGAATLIVSGSNTYACATVISNGLLLVNGSHKTNTTGYAVLTGASLGGTGVVFSAVTVASGGTLVAGGTNRVGALTVGGLTFASGATNRVRIAGAAGAERNAVNVTGGSVTLGNAALALDDSGISGDAARLTLIDNQTAGAVSGTFAGLAEGAVLTGASGRKWVITYSGGAGNNDVVLAPAQRGTMIRVF